jgi:hypothetical protein
MKHMFAESQMMVDGMLAYRELTWKVESRLQYLNSRQRFHFISTRLPHNLELLLCACPSLTHPFTSPLRSVSSFVFPLQQTTQHTQHNSPTDDMAKKKMVKEIGKMAKEMGRDGAKRGEADGRRDEADEAESGHRGPPHLNPSTARCDRLVTATA